MFDLFEYLSNQVPANPVAGNVQHPVMKAHMQDNFPMALRKGGLLKSLKPRRLHRRKRVPTKLRPAPGGNGAISALSHGTLALRDLVSRRRGPSTLPTAGNGRAAWHAALRTLAFGGGGKDISLYP